MPIDAIILAGAPAEPGMNPVGGKTSRAMIPIAGKTMLQWVVDALASSMSVGRIIAVGDVEAEGLDKVVEPSNGFLDNIMLGLNSSGSTEAVLMVSSDIPLVTAEGIDDFVMRGQATGADMCYPIVRKEACLARYPDMKRTYLRTREGTFTGGNILLLKPEFILRNESKIAGAYAARKKVLTLAAMIGFGVLFRAVLAQLLFPSLLPVPMLERAVSKLLGGRVEAIQTDYAEIGEDVDKPEDVVAVDLLLR